LLAIALWPAALTVAQSDESCIGNGARITVGVLDAANSAPIEGVVITIEGDIDSNSSDFVDCGDAIGDDGLPDDVAGPSFGFNVVSNSGPADRYRLAVLIGPPNCNPPSSQALQVTDNAATYNVTFYLQCEGSTPNANAPTATQAAATPTSTSSPTAGASATASSAAATSTSVPPTTTPESPPPFTGNVITPAPPTAAGGATTAVITPPNTGDGGLMVAR
jgi:hypothetical protein